MPGLVFRRLLDDSTEKSYTSTIRNYTTSQKVSTVQSVERAFAILKAISADGDGLGTTEIARRVGLPISTVSRLLGTLESVEAVERLPRRSGFRVGPGAIALVQRVPHHRQLTVLTRPCLLELAEATGEAVTLCLPDGDQIYVADQAQNQRRVQLQDVTGQRFPLHATSSGKVFLAHRSEEDLTRYLERPLERFTAATITDPVVLRSQLSNVRKRGYAWAREEYDEIAGVSAPIHDGAGAVVAAVNLYGPTFRFPPEGQADEMARLVVRTGSEISERVRN
jgi:DNA-binding IclR family transcriptional regulator